MAKGCYRLKNQTFFFSKTTLFSTFFSKGNAGPFSYFSSYLEGLPSLCSFQVIKGLSSLCSFQVTLKDSPLSDLFKLSKDCPVLFKLSKDCHLSFLIKIDCFYFGSFANMIKNLYVAHIYLLFMCWHFIG